MSPHPTDPLLATLQGARPRLYGRLRAAFPGVCASLVEDAAAVAVTEVWLGRHRWTDTTGWAALLYTIAWRQLRGELRRMHYRGAVGAGTRPELLHAPDALALLDARRTLRAIPRLAPEAARRYAPRRASLLAEALLDRLESGDTDGEVASRHGVDRSLLCRARLWMRDSLMGEEQAVA